MRDFLTAVTDGCPPKLRQQIELCTEEIFANIAGYAYEDGGKVTVRAAKSAVLATVDLNGTLIIDVCENYADKGVVDSFLRICKEFGMNIKETETTVFEQTNLKL